MAGLERLEERSLFSAYVFQDALAALGVSGVVAESGPPLPPQGVVYARYGHGAVALGDLDGDGCGDYAVSAPGQASLIEGGSIPGAVFVRSGQTGDVLHTFTDGFADFGVSLARLGDVNGDGWDDLAVGSPWFDGTDNATIDPAGRVWVFSGSDGGVLATFEGSAPFDEFGVAIAATADMDFDGVRELLVGAPGADQAVVFSVAGFAVLLTLTGEQPGERFGAAVAAAHVENRPIAIGAPFHSGVGANSGRVYLFAPNGTLLYDRTGASAGDEYGASLVFVSGSPGPVLPTLLLAIGVPGQDAVVVGGQPSGPYGGAAADRGGVEVLVANNGLVASNLGGVKVPGARFGQVVANAGDIDGDGADDLAVLAPGVGTTGEASFFRHTGSSFQSVSATWDSLVPLNIGTARLSDLPGRGVGAVGDINNDGFPDVLLGDADQSVKVMGAYALGSPSFIDGASDNLQFTWSNTGGRPFLVSQGEIRTFSKIAGLLQAPPNSPQTARSRIEAINNNGVIVFRNHPAMSPDSTTELMVLQNGEGVTLGSLVTSVEGGDAPDYTTLTLVELGDGDHFLLSGGGVWVLHEGVLTLIPFDAGIDINSSGTALGRRTVDGVQEYGVWTRGGEFMAIAGFETANAINDLGAVTGVLAGTRGGLNPGNLGVWSNGVLTDLGPTPGSYGNSQTPTWEFRGFDDAGRILADIRQDQIRTANDLLTTFLFEPETGLRALPDATHGFTISTESFGTWTDFSPSTFAGPGFSLAPDGRILAYGAVLEQVDDDAPWILRADSPTASLSTPAGQFFAGVNQFGEVVVFRVTESGVSRDRVSTRLVTPTNTNLVMFTTPGSTLTAYLVVANRGQMNISSIDTGVGGGADIHFANRPAAENAIVDNLTVFTNAAGVIHLVGFDEYGDLVIYFLPDQALASFPGAWVFDNLSTTHLDARGQETPEIVSNLTAFATPWGTMHVAGLDAAGHVQVVWWGPDSPLWRVDDLTANAETPRNMQGNISAFITPWSTLHINGADEQGRTVALWWAPEFGGTWRVDQLAPTGSLRLIPGTITSYVTAWGGLNVVGRDELNGRATAYWWSPESNVWTAEVLRVENGEFGPPLAGSIGANASEAGTLNMFSRDLNGHATRLFWNPGDGAFWTLQDLSVLA